MKNQKMHKQMAEVLNLSTTTNHKAYSIAFDEDGVLVDGVSNDKINPQIAIIYSSKNGKKIFSGYVNQVSITDDTKTTLVAIDIRKVENPIVFLTVDSFISKVNSKSSFSLDDIVVVYWEYGPYSFLSLTVYDLSKAKVITKHILEEKPSNKGFYRRILLSLLPEKESSQFKQKLISHIYKDHKESVESFYE